MAEIRCPECGGQTIVLTSKEDGRRYYVCVNRPKCKGKLAVDEAWGHIWGEERPVTRGAGGTWQQAGASNSKDSAVPASHRLEEGKRWLGMIFKRSKRAEVAPVEESWGDDWGDDKRESRVTPYKPEQPKNQGQLAASGGRETPGPRSTASGVGAGGGSRGGFGKASRGGEGVWGDDWGGGSPAMKPAGGEARPQPQRVRDLAHILPDRWKAARAARGTTDRGKETRSAADKPRPRKERKPAEDKPKPRKEQKPAADKPKPRREQKPGRDVSKRRKGPKAVPDKTKRKRELPAAQKERAAAVKKKPAKPRHKKAAKRKVIARRTVLLSPQPLTEEEEEAMLKRRRKLVIMIIALLAAFLAIDGMIYAVILLR